MKKIHTFIELIFLSQVSSDLSLVDLDVPFSFIFSVSATLNAYSNLAVLAFVTWPVLFVSIPMVYLTIRLQVISTTVFSDSWVLSAILTE